MSPVTAHQHSGATQVLDAELPLLASEAAIEIDALIQGKTACPLTAVKELGNWLEGSIRYSGDNHEQKSLMDSATVAVMSRAILDSQWNIRLKTVDEVIGEAARIAGSLKSDSPKKEMLEKMRTFCVALSRCAASYRQSIYDITPSHPYRR